MNNSREPSIIYLNSSFLLLGINILLSSILILFISSRGYQSVLYHRQYLRRTDSMTPALINSTRDTAGLPCLIWNALSMGNEPVLLYLICIPTISFCTNIQISFIFAMNKNVRIVFWDNMQRMWQ